MRVKRQMTPKKCQNGAETTKRPRLESFQNDTMNDTGKTFGSVGEDSKSPDENDDAMDGLQSSVGDGKSVTNVDAVMKEVSDDVAASGDKAVTKENCAMDKLLKTADAGKVKNVTSENEAMEVIADKGDASEDKKVTKEKLPNETKKPTTADADEDNYDFLNLDNNDFNFAGLHAAATIALAMAKQKHLDLKTWKRCTIVTMEINIPSFDLVLLVRADDATALCHLQGPWRHMRMAVGDILSLQALWDNKLNAYRIDKDYGFCVTNPDTLISGTALMGSIFCRRKAVLQDRFRGIDESSKVMVIGSLVHELLQTVLEKGLKTNKEISDAAQNLMKSQETAKMLYQSRMTCKELEAEVQNFVPNIFSFLQQYIAPGERTMSQSEQRFDGKITKICDIEENIWSPQLGLKGKVDVSVRIRRRRGALNNFDSALKKIVVPLELKTGRATFSVEHTGQLILYQMMLSVGGRDTRSGLLLYLREGIMREIEGVRNEQRDLIVLRNDLVYYLTRPPTLLPLEDLPKLPDGKYHQPFVLPEPISHHSACKTCGYRTICCSFAKTDPKLELSHEHPLRNVMNMVTSHLTPADYAYFIHWIGLIALEDEQARKSNYLRSLWTDTPEMRQRNGHAMIGLQLGEGVVMEESRYNHTFVMPSAIVKESEVDLTLFGFSLGEYVIVSSSRRLAIAAGLVSDITPHSISISLERNLHKNYADQTFIVDKHESQSGNAFNLTNLGLLIHNTEHLTAMRAIIVGGVLPTFSRKLPKNIVLEGAAMIDGLNAEQRSAILKSLCTESYSLIKGLPGSGKTQTLVALVRLLHFWGKTVLITSHTHSAIDNLMLRLKPYRLPMLRLGSNARIHPDLHNCSEQECVRGDEAELVKKYAAFPIVGVTCLGSTHSIFMHRRFDYCIVDEATQVMQPTVLRPLFSCDRFVLVGDPDQLPPLVRSQEARKRGATESLFHRLDSVKVTSVLTLQYRMNKTIMKLANQLAYNGALKCGSDAVELATIKLKVSISAPPIEKWLQRTLQTHIDQSVFLLDTLNCTERSLDFAKAKHNSTWTAIEKNFAEAEDCAEKKEETAASTSTDKCAEKNLEASTASVKRVPKYTNYCEAAVIFCIVRVLLDAGYDADRIGIITPYRSQVKLLDKLAAQHDAFHTSLNFAAVEINTVDQYQGRDKDIILYSGTKTGVPVAPERSRDTEILEDIRRLTVAITRAKLKLILVCDATCMMQYTPFKTMLANVRNISRLRLEDGPLGFQWQKVLEQLNEIISG